MVTPTILGCGIDVHFEESLAEKLFEIIDHFSVERINLRERSESLRKQSLH